MLKRNAYCFSSSSNRLQNAVQIAPKKESAVQCRLEIFVRDLC